MSLKYIRYVPAGAVAPGPSNIPCPNGMSAGWAPPVLTPVTVSSEFNRSRIIESEYSVPLVGVIGRGVHKRLIIPCAEVTDRAHHRICFYFRCIIWFYFPCHINNINSNCGISFYIERAFVSEIQYSVRTCTIHIIVTTQIFFSAEFKIRSCAEISCIGIHPHSPDYYRSGT